MVKKEVNMERSQQVNVDVHIFYPVKTKVPSDMS